MKTFNLYAMGIEVFYFPAAILFGITKGGVKNV
jgi:hypothetical protein